mgnify:CR=1 FL=1
MVYITKRDSPPLQGVNRCPLLFVFLCVLCFFLFFTLTAIGKGLRYWVVIMITLGVLQW